MKVYTLHIKNMSSAKVAKLKEKVKRSNFASLNDDLDRRIRDRMRGLDLDLGLPFYFPNDRNIFISKKYKAILMITHAGPSSDLELTLVSHDDEAGSQYFRNMVKKTQARNVRMGSIDEGYMVEDLKKRLGKLSTSGKLLAKKDLAGKFPLLYDQKNRTVLREILQTFGNMGFSGDSVKRLTAWEKTKITPESFLNTGEFFEKRYAIHCKACGTQPLEFPSRTQAEGALANSRNTRCAFCRVGKYEVSQAYTITDGMSKGLEQGLWLESLVHSIASRNAVFTAAGRMLDSFELDVVAVYCGKVILFECKDTSFGQNDYVILTEKARELQANVMCIVTTRPIHENVKNLIERQQSRTGRRDELGWDIWVVADTQSFEGIEKAITRFFDDVLRRYARHVLVELGVSRREHRRIFRSRMLRPTIPSMKYWYPT